jgi:hypothetical protein
MRLALVATFAAALASCATTAEAPTEPAPQASPATTGEATDVVRARGYRLTVPAGMSLFRGDASSADDVRRMALGNRVVLAVGDEPPPRGAGLTLDVGHRSFDTPRLDDAECDSMAPAFEERAKQEGRQVAVSVSGLDKLGALDVCHVTVTDPEGSRQDVFVASPGRLMLMAMCTHAGAEPSQLQRCREALGSVSLTAPERAHGTGYSIPIPKGFTGATAKVRTKLGESQPAMLHAAVVVATERRGAQKVLGSINVIAAADDGSDPGDQAVCETLAQGLQAAIGRPMQSATAWAAGGAAGCQVDGVEGGQHTRFHTVGTLGVQMVVTCTLADEDKAGLSGCDEVARDIQEADADLWWRPALEAG